MNTMLSEDANLGNKVRKDKNILKNELNACILWVVDALWKLEMPTAQRVHA